MKKLTIQEEINSSKALTEKTEYTYFIEKEELKKIQNSEKLEIRKEYISIYFLENLFKDKECLKYVKKFFNNEIDKFNICSIYNGDTIGNISHTKYCIISGLEYLISHDKISLSRNEEEEYNKLKETINFNKFLDNIKDKHYEIMIDNNQYAFPISRLIYVMSMKEDKFNDICNNDSIKYIDEVPKKHFIYAAYKYFKESGVFHNYNVPSKIYDRYKEIKELQKIDLEALNKFLETKSNMHNEIKINENLRKSILEDMPKYISDVEKAIYIYIKMCKVLTYDEEYYAANQKGNPALKHKDISYVSKITPKNNKVVCFEFNIIYSKFLDELGVKFRTIYKGMTNESYGEGHANLKFRSGKYLVKADSVTSILQGDIMQAKLNQPLKGLKSFNRNIHTYNEFNKLVTRIYKFIASKEKKNQKVEYIENFEEIVRRYTKVTNNIKEISLKERLLILIDKVNSSNMIGIDSLSYALQLERILFSNIEHLNNIFITILRSNICYNGEEKIVPCIIFTLNSCGYLCKKGENIYYYFKPNEEFKTITKEELQRKFDDGEFEYVSKNDPVIPGIDEKRGIKNDRKINRD